MIADVDAALKTLLQTGLGVSGVDMAFEPPTKDWASRRSGPTINLFLADIRENLERRSIDLVDVRDDSGVVVARRPRERTYSLTYALTTWATNPDDEHKLLGSALRCLLRHDTLPPTPDRLFEPDDPAADKPMPMRVGLPSFSDRLATEMWTAVGADYHPTLWVLIDVPVGAGTDQPAGPPQTQPPVFVFQDDAQTIRERVLGEDPANPGSLRTRTRPAVTSEPSTTSAKASGKPAKDVSGKGGSGKASS